MKNFSLSGILLATITTVAVGGCSSNQPEVSESATKIYNTAYGHLRRSNYASAIEKYEELEQKYPFSKYARRALLESAYANYKNGESEKTIALTDRFVKNHPGDPNLDYAYYLKGITHFNRGKTLLHHILPRDMSAKSTGSLLMAFAAFSDLHNKFPKSAYRADAKKRLVVLRNMLAIHEIRVAAFYLEQGSYIATINRIKYMLEKYEGAQHTADGLYLMATAYERIGSHDLARDTLRVLKLNYPHMLDKEMDYVPQVGREEQKSWLEGARDMSDIILEKIN